MTTKELCAIRHWIHENVFGWSPAKESEYPHRKGWLKDGVFCVENDEPDYPTDPAASMLVLEKCADNHDSPIHIWHRQDESYKGKWHVADNQWQLSALAETLPLAIAKFSKSLFPK